MDEIGKVDESITREELAGALVTLWRLVNSMPPKSIPVDGMEYVRSCNGYGRDVAPVLTKLGHDPFYK